ncbi:Histidine-containing phosphotransfer protein 5 [Hibiscus syriacus]|uniref:Histidine-containing phosphotransfer protein n=1 Tax=Hibiscus syriacus TaxID=106335 RepID=A0A6A3B5E2_HIBSY|nr:Histidine-containing phosphotransfer protein 5 [Hibiscus syriacus]
MDLVQLQRQLVDYRTSLYHERAADHRFQRIDALVHQLKGSSSSIGAQRVRKLCIVFRNNCEAQNVEGCLNCLQQVKHEYSIVKTKLESMFQLEQQILTAGGSIPV